MKKWLENKFKQIKKLAVVDTVYGKARRYITPGWFRSNPVNTVELLLSGKANVSVCPVCGASCDASESFENFEYNYAHDGTAAHEYKCSKCCNQWWRAIRNKSLSGVLVMYIVPRD